MFLKKQFQIWFLVVLFFSALYLVHASHKGLIKPCLMDIFVRVLRLLIFMIWGPPPSFWWRSWSQMITVAARCSAFEKLIETGWNMWFWITMCPNWYDHMSDCCWSNLLLQQNSFLTRLAFFKLRNFWTTSAISLVNTLKESLNWA